MDVRGPERVAEEPGPITAMIMRLGRRSHEIYAEIIVVACPRYHSTYGPPPPTRALRSVTTQERP
jgi:hypothetical protein